MPTKNSKNIYTMLDGIRQRRRHKAEANMAVRSRHDIAYLCFLVPWAACLVAATTPTDIGTVGFVVLMPLMIGSLAAIPFGVYCSILLWRDVILPLLSILTIIMIAVAVTVVYYQLGSGSAAGSAESYNTLHGVLVLIGTPVLILEGSWFLFRRRRA